MTRTHRALAILVAAFAFAPHSARLCGGQTTPPGAATSRAGAAQRGELEALVRQLGDDSFTAREAATERLIAAGLAARPFLQQGSNDPDPEIRHRSAHLLAEVEIQDRRRRLDAFIADDGTNRETYLPGWNAFRERIGDGRPARVFFAKIYDSEPELMAAYEADPSGSVALLDERTIAAAEIQGTPGALSGDASLGGVAALLFVASDQAVELSMIQTSRIFSLAQSHPAVRSFQAQAGQGHPMLFELTNAWIARMDFGGSASLQYQVLRFAMQINLPSSVGVAKSLMRTSNAQSAYRMYGALCIGKLGGAEDISTLVAMLEDEAVCMSRTAAGQETPLQLQVRDVALACLLHMTQQDLASYGFTTAQLNSSYLFNPSTLFWEQPEQRDEALAKWRRWSAEHLERPRAEP
jgi:hypothetical protein